MSHLLKGFSVEPLVRGSCLLPCAVTPRPVGGKLRITESDLTGLSPRAVSQPTDPSVHRGAYLIDAGRCFLPGSKAGGDAP